MNDMMDDIPSRVAVLEEIARGTKAILERIESRLDRIGGRMDRMDDRLDHMDGRIDSRLGQTDGRIDGLATEHRADFRSQTNRTDSQFRWMLGIMLGGFAGLLGVMAHGFHWL